MYVQLICMHVDDEKSQLLNLWQGPTAGRDSCYPVRKDRGLLARDAFHRSAVQVSEMPPNGDAVGFLL